MKKWRMPPLLKGMLQISCKTESFRSCVKADVSTIEKTGHRSTIRPASRNARDRNGTLRCCFGDGVGARVKHAHDITAFSNPRAIHEMKVFQAFGSTLFNRCLWRADELYVARMWPCTARTLCNGELVVDAVGDG